jgi:MFS family permease
VEQSRARRYAAAFGASLRAAVGGTARAARGTARGTARAARGTAGVTSRASRATARTIRRATNAQGAGESGLAKLIELHAVNAAGDVLVAISLAGTLFFSVPVGEARGRVALYLLITMAPFAVMAPIIGPLLDRVRSGRRYALATTMLVRAFLAWQMAGSVSGGEPDLWLYPAAFGVLVASKSYGVTRSATVPRLLPSAFSLVRANSRISLAGIIAGGVAAGVGGALAYLGPEWSLRAAFLVFVAGMVLAIRLPARVDSAAGELGASDPGFFVLSPARWLTGLSAAVVMGMGTNAALRAFSGFLTMFLAFLLRQDPIGGLTDVEAIGLVAGAAAVGGFLGTSLGALLRSRAPEAILVTVLALETATVVAAVIWYGLPAVLGAGFVAGFAQTLGKLSLDALIQRDVDEEVRTSAFARSETVLQLSWVIGGGIGISLPLRGDIGLGLAAAGLAVALLLVVRALRQVLRQPRRDQAVTTPDTEPEAARARPDQPDNPRSTQAHGGSAADEAPTDPLFGRRWYET